MHGERTLQTVFKGVEARGCVTDEQLQNHFDAFDQILKETVSPPIWNGKTLIPWKEFHKHSIEFARQCHGQLGIDQPQ